MKYLNWLLIGLVVLCLTTVPLAGCVLETGVSESEYGALQAEYEALEVENTSLRAELEEVQGDYEKLQQEYTILHTTKEMVFGEGVRLFDIQWKKGYWGILEGKVQNISDKPMERVEIIVAEYSQDGSLRGFYSTSKSDLFPQEVAEWSISSIFLEDGGLYEKEIDEILAIYAFGNRGG